MAAVAELPHCECAEQSVTRRRTDDAIRDLAHDLRQPLSAIEAIAYYLEMTLPADQLAARQQLLRVQELVEQSSLILSRALTTETLVPA